VLEEIYHRGVGDFVDVFGVDAGGEPDEEPEYLQPAWFGPPQDELGVCLPVSRVLGRSDRAVIALKSITVHSTGMLLELVAVARGLRQAEANGLFHQQHLADPEEGLPDGFIRVGLEYGDGTRVSNLDRRHLWQSDQEPDGPVLYQASGGGGQTGRGGVSMSPAYWLWPLPPAGSLDLAVEWPALGIKLSRTQFEGDAIAGTAQRARSLWSEE
jgi:hypothetical protein